MRLPLHSLYPTHRTGNRILYSGRRHEQSDRGYLARPSSDGTVLAPFDEIPILEAHPFNGRGEWAFIVDTYAWSAVPVVAVGLIVHLDNVLARSGDDALRIEHHAGDRL